MRPVKFGSQEVVIGATIVFFLFVLLLLYEVYVPFSDINVDCYEYPGNGIGLISVNKRAKNLEADIGIYTQTFLKAKLEDGKLICHDVKSFKFKSPKKIRTEGFFSLEVKTEVKSGQCNIGMGNIVVKLREKELLVENRGKVVFENKDIKVLSLDFFHFPVPDGSLELVIIANRRSTRMAYQKLESPAYITLELSDDFSGSIGPWTWVRGYE